jgi:Fic family protein
VDYIHDLVNWPKLEWNDTKLSPLLAEVRHRQGRLLGRMEGLGFRLRAEGATERFYSMSTQIEAEKKQYYLSLERSQKGGLDITSWLEWFLGCLGRAVAGAEAGLASVLRKARIWERINSQSSVSDRQRNVINRLLDGFEGKLSTSKYASLAKCSPDTALRDIGILLHEGILIREEGGGRNTRYRLAEPEERAGGETAGTWPNSPAKAAGSSGTSKP